MVSLGSSTQGTMENHRMRERGDARDEWGEATSQCATTELPNFLSFSVAILACQLFFHDTLRPKEIPNSSMYQVVESEQLTRYLCPNHYWHLKKKIHTNRKKNYYLILQGRDYLRIGCMYLLDTVQSLEPRNRTGHCHLHFLLHIEF